MRISEMETDALKDAAASLYQSIYVLECSSALDEMRLLAMEEELDKRGWESREVMALTFVEKGEDEEEGS